MKWNIFNSVSALEQKVKDLTDFINDHSRWIARLEEKVHKLENANQLLVNSNQALIRKQENHAERLKDLAHEIYMQSRQPDPVIATPDPRLPVFKQIEVNTEANEKLLKKRQYQREWASKMRVKKMEKAKAQLQREKKNAYARAYYLRTKGKKQ